MRLGKPYGLACHDGAVIRLRPVAFVVAAWILGATTSVGVGLLALTLVGEDLRGDASRPLTADAAVVAEQPSALVPTPTAASSPTPSASATEPTATGDDRRLSSPGGDVVARCTTAGAYLVYWSPGQGFRTDHVNRGPAQIATVSFEGPTSEVRLTITCAGSVPQLEVAHDD
jgi:hypothetical protein